MRLPFLNVKLGIVLLLGVSAGAQDIKLNVTYVCGGERIYVENCNIRDLSDTSTCMVAHPDRPKHNGFMAYTYETRGTLKKLFPTCTQPTAQELAKAEAFKKKQQEIYDAAVAKANPQANQANNQSNAGRAQAPQGAGSGAVRPPKNAEERAMRRCVSSGRLPATCTGNQLLGAFGQMLGQVLPSAAKEPAPGPVQIDGVIVTGYNSGLRDASGNPVTANYSGPVFDNNGQRVSHSANLGHATFAPKRASCPALNLSSKGAGAGIQTMQTDLLKSIFNDGDKGPPTPPGIRMHGIFAASTGFSAQFFPESVILGCGPDSARAYPYTVVADGTRMGIKIDAPDHPLTLAFGPNGSLDAGSGPYQVHGRMAIGQNDNGDFTFAPMEQTCNLAVLTPSKTIPSGGGVTALPSAAPPGTPGPANRGGSLSTPDAPLGNATLSIVSGFPARPGAPNPLAGRPYLLLRDSYANVLAKGGVSVPAGMSPYKYVGIACGGRTPDCPKITGAVKANAISAARADANGAGTLPGVAPGTYYLMISALYNNQTLVWGQAVQLKAGPNSVRLDQSNAVPIK